MIITKNPGPLYKSQLYLQFKKNFVERRSRETGGDRDTALYFNFQKKDRGQVGAGGGGGGGGDEAERTCSTSPPEEEEKESGLIGSKIKHNRGTKRTKETARQRFLLLRLKETMSRVQREKGCASTAKRRESNRSQPKKDFGAWRSREKSKQGQASWAKEEKL